jgi:hypothetical protein
MGLVGATAWAAPVLAANPAGGILGGAEQTVTDATQTVSKAAKPVGEATATTLSPPASPEASSPAAPASPPALPAGAASISSAAITAPQPVAPVDSAVENALPKPVAPVDSAVENALPKPVAPVDSAVTQLTSAKSTVAGAPLGGLASTLASTLGQVTNTQGAGAPLGGLASTLASTLGQVTNTTGNGGLVAPSFPTPPSSALTLPAPPSLGPRPAIVAPGGSSGLPMGSVAPTFLIAHDLKGGGGGFAFGGHRSPESMPFAPAPGGPMPWNETFALGGSASSCSFGGISSGPAPVHAPPGPPTPGGVSSSVAGLSGSSGFSVFLLLAGLMALGALQAKRRLRLASESWCPAPFLLMPERPG